MLGSGGHTDGVHEDIYEKWLRRRLDYAIIRETGNHAAPGFVHTILHSGAGPSNIVSEVREEMWRNNRYPYSNYFQHGQVLYGYPPLLKEVLDFRFSGSTQHREVCGTKAKNNFYDLSLQEIATVPNWLGPLIINSCPYPHTLETPLTWTLGKGKPEIGIKPCPHPRRVNTPLFPACCHRHDNVCSAVYCRDPPPQTVYIPGPMGRGEAHFKWHLNHPEGKGRVTPIINAQKEMEKNKPAQNRCSCV